MGILSNNKEGALFSNALEEEQAKWDELQNQIRMASSGHKLTSTKHLGDQAGNRSDLKTEGEWERRINDYKMGLLSKGAGKIREKVADSETSKNNPGWGSFFDILLGGKG